ncbi:2758_t:CDS:2 [Dentiscutata heterogama]|uniref:2758_t:CDS:1 n=1 Tax=Dentiscutata heterogama TaxID=1316150 RepID=A0ACA9KV87_9GLOM|nr:2758_t:CDS:2 [Dentiscutata heterogama]
MFMNDISQYAKNSIPDGYFPHYANLKWICYHLNGGNEFRI